MSECWLVRAPDAAGPWSWSTAGLEAGQGDVPALAAALAAGPRRPVVVLLPSARVLAVPVAAPLRQQRQLLQALPFLIEENLAGEVERCHVAAGRRIDAQRLQVLAVDRAWLGDLLAQLRQAGVDPAVVSSEALALPLPERGLTLLLDGPDSLLATADGHTLVFDQNDMDVVAAGLPAGAGDTVRVLLAERGDALAVRALESAWLVAGGESPVFEFADVPRPRLELLAESAAAQRPPNLRQGLFAAAGESAFSLGFDWRPLAWLAAGWAVLALGYQLASGISHDRAARAVVEAQVALYRQVFPQEQKVPSPRQQMENHLRAGAGAGAGFTSLVASTAEAIAALDTDGGRYTPRSLGWDAQQSQLRVDILARSLEDFEKLRLDLQQRGLRVDVGSGVSQEGGYKARMNIGLAAAEGA